jgi:CheY-like chemotaxis protein
MVAIVLVVEDEPLLRMVAVDIVEGAGFQAVEASNADDAIQILETRTDIRIVFTDIDMPGSIDGLKLAAAVRRKWPPISIIVVSGHRRPMNGELPDGSVFFAKPYSVDEVTSTLQQMVA